MRLDCRGEYPADWPELSLSVRVAAGWRCVRCRHPFEEGTGHAMPCDEFCDPQRCRGRRIAARLGNHNFGVHHLTGDKANRQWWNLLALCNSCHLSIQARVIPERPWLFEHSDWFRIYAAGFYAWYYAGLYVTREEAWARVDDYLALGQPWLAAAGGSR